MGIPALNIESTVQDIPIAVVDSSFLLDLAANYYSAIGIQQYLMKNGFTYILPIERVEGQSVLGELEKIISSKKKDKRGLALSGELITGPIDALKLRLKNEDYRLKSKIHTIEVQEGESEQDYNNRVLQEIEEINVNGDGTFQNLVAMQVYRKFDQTKRDFATGFSRVDKSLIEASNMFAEKHFNNVVLATSDGELKRNAHPLVEVLGRKWITREIEELVFNEVPYLYSAKFIRDLNKHSSEETKDVFYGVLAQDIETRNGFRENFFVGSFRAQPYTQSTLSEIEEDVDVKIVPFRIIRNIDQRKLMLGRKTEFLTYDQYGTYITSQPQNTEFFQVGNPLTSREYIKVKPLMMNLNKLNPKKKGKLKERLSKLDEVCVTGACYPSRLREARTLETELFPSGNPLSRYRIQARKALEGKGIKFYES